MTAHAFRVRRGWASRSEDGLLVLGALVLIGGWILLCIWCLQFLNALAPLAQ